MATVVELLRGHELITVRHDQSVLDAVLCMVEHNVGAVPVLKSGELAGVFSERDVMKRVMVNALDPRRTPISEVMSPDPLTVPPEESIHDCMVLMKQHGFRHLPVCSEGRLIGFLSLRDLLLYEVDEKDIEVRMMRAYISS